MNDKTSKKSISYGVISFFVLLILQMISYFGFLIKIPNFLAKYLWWMIYLDITIVSLGIAIHYMMSYRSKAPCMTGMMVGMTIGMQIGMMLGAVIGATNGYFTGAMVGMILGSIGGIVAGRINKNHMSWVQGLMSGIMGGTMGPMISVMMFTDRILIFMPFYIILNLILIYGFVKMYHEELIVDNKDLIHNNVGFASFISACILVMFVMMLIMIYGPKGALFA